jgi:hypothetical protein
MSMLVFVFMNELTDAIYMFSFNRSHLKVTSRTTSQMCSDDTNSTPNV